MSNLNKVNIGEVLLYTLVEEEGDASIDVLVGASPEVIEQYAPTGFYPRAVNAYLFNNKGVFSLFDTGFGRHLFEQMDALKVSYSDIQNIYLTHLHPDHIGGLLKDDIILFPNANVHLSQAEHDYWMSDDQKKIAGQQKMHYFDAARKMLTLYKNQLNIQNPVNLKSAMLSHDLISMVEAYGHTPGHVMYLIQDVKNKLLVCGDLIHALRVQLPHPEVAVVYDVDISQAINTRINTLTFAAKYDIPLAGMHIPYGGVVLASEESQGFSFTLASHK